MFIVFVEILTTEKIKFIKKKIVSLIIVLQLQISLEYIGDVYATESTYNNVYYLKNAGNTQTHTHPTKWFIIITVYTFNGAMRCDGCKYKNISTGFDTYNLHQECV